MLDLDVLEKEVEKCKNQYGWGHADSVNAVCDALEMRLIDILEKHYDEGKKRSRISELNRFGMWSRDYLLKKNK